MAAKVSDARARGASEKLISGGIHLSVGSVNSAGRLAGKVAVITGGAAGMARIGALAFAREGARVSIFDIQEAAGHATVQIICDAGGAAIFAKADVSSAGQIDHGFDQAIKAFGPYNVLFNHAGPIVKALHETTEDE